MTPAQIAEAQKLSREYWGKYVVPFQRSAAQKGSDADYIERRYVLRYKTGSRVSKNMVTNSLTLHADCFRCRV